MAARLDTVSASLKTTASPRHLELHLPAEPEFLVIVEMAAHVYVAALPGGAALGERVENEILETARGLCSDGVHVLVVTLECDSRELRGTVSTEGAAASPVVLVWGLGQRPRYPTP